MHFLKWPASLWFLAAGTGTDLQKSVTSGYNITASTVISIDFLGTTVLTDVSSGYYISGSIHPVTSVDIELSAFAYNVTASVQGSLQANLSATPAGEYSPLAALVTATPVFVLDISGQNDVSTSAAYNISATFTASLFPQIPMSAAYNISASTSAAVLIYENVSISAAYNITASTNLQLTIAIGQLEKILGTTYNLTASVFPSLRIGKGGGLVWSRKKRRRFAMRIGSVESV